MKYERPEKVRQFLKTIPNHLYRLDYEAIKIECNSILPSIPVSLIDFTNDNFFFNQMRWGGLNVIYRARQITNPENTPHKSISQISYVPDDEKHKLDKFGRINKPTEPMFYGSLDFATACTEAIINPNVYRDTGLVMMTVGVWKFETPLILAEMPYSEKYFKLLFDIVHFKSKNIQIEDIRQWNTELRNRFETDIEYEILQFFADEFAKFDTENDYEYKLSNYYADRVFNRIRGFEIGDEVDGIIYPSVSHSYLNKNIVLKPEVVDKKLKFIHAMQILKTRDGNGGTRCDPIFDNIKADSDGKLLWYHSSVQI